MTYNRLSRAPLAFLITILSFTGFLTDARAQNQAGLVSDVLWEPLGYCCFGSSGFGEAYALAIGSDGVVYAGGDGLETPHDRGSVIRWDGSNGSVLRYGPSPPVRTVLVSPDGRVYVGGRFNALRHQAAGNIARWSGMFWGLLGTGLNGEVQALAMGPEGTLYAGGRFNEAGGQPAYYIAQWDGEAWAPLGMGLRDSAYALVVGEDGTLYAGGMFGIERWDGAEWDKLGAGLEGHVNALVLGPDGTLYAGGRFNTHSNVVQWDGLNWSSLGTGITWEVRALVVGLDGSLYAGGALLKADSRTTGRVARWFDGEWTGLGSDIAVRVNALAISTDGELYAGGNYGGSGPPVSKASNLPVSIHASRPLPATVTLSAPHPNPAADVARTAFTLEHDAHVRVTVYDVLGRAVVQLVDRMMPPGEHDVTIPAGSLSSGSYLVQIKAGAQVRARPFVVVR